MNLLLIMRKGYRAHLDHIVTLRNLNASLHLVTEVPSAEVDPRFTTVTLLPAGASASECIDRSLATACTHDVDAAITFQETDIVLTAELNRRLGVRSTKPEAARTARNKAEQRRFLGIAGIPSVMFSEVADIGLASAQAERIGYPLIVKPTQAASSCNVALVHDQIQLQAELRRIEDLARSGRGRYYEGGEGTFALVEEFLPGNEVTVDGVVLDGQFHLGGIHDKMRTAGPYFEEDFYTLPFSAPECEGEIEGIAQAIATHLGLECSLLNVEMRQDANGKFRVVEFSPRISGGHVYRNIRDVYGTDLVALFAAALTRAEAPTQPNGRILDVRRGRPRMTTCIKFVYRAGRVLRNNPGEAYHSPNYMAYFPVAEAGRRIARPPAGFDIAGLLSVAAPYRDETSLAAVRAIAVEVEQRLDLVVHS